MPKQVFSLRFDPLLMEKIDRYAREHGWSAHHAESGVRGGDHRGKDTGRTALITHVLEALVEGRLRETPRAGANPFPAEEVEAGSTPELPLLISRPRPFWVKETIGVGVANLRGISHLDLYAGTGSVSLDVERDGETASPDNSPTPKPKGAP